jgi:hypothetical protein
MGFSEPKNPIKVIDLVLPRLHLLESVTGGLLPINKTGFRDLSD